MRHEVAIRRRPAVKVPDGLQYAALPFRVNGRKVEVLLITSRRTRRWIVPKGWPIPGMLPPDCARVEALEEAGVEGDVLAEPLGHYRYIKHHKKRPSQFCTVEVYALRVSEQRRTWPEKSERDRRWCALETAAAMVEEEQLQALIREFASRLI